MLTVALTLAGLAGVGEAAAPPYHLVACAPGYPGTTISAQPTMDLLAARWAAAASLEPSAITAEYRPDESEGLRRLRDRDTDLGLVPLPFFLQYADELDLRPIAQAVRSDGTQSERWSLVAAPGRLGAAADLAGWEVVGIPAYHEAFVRGPILGTWGTLPAEVEIVFSGRVLGALRRIGAGEPVAVLLDEEQVAALASLPDPGAYAVVHTSQPLPVAMVVAVGDRLDAEETAGLAAALMSLGTEEDGDELLSTLRLRGFAAVDREALDRAAAALGVGR